DAGAGQVTTVLEDGVNKLDRLRSVRDSVNQLSISADETLGYYTSAITAFLDAIAKMAKMTGSAELSTMLTAYVNFLYVKEKEGIERAMMTNTFAKNNFAPGVFDKFNALLASMDTYKNVFLSLATVEQKGFFEGKTHGKETDEVIRMRAIAFEKADKGNFGVDPVYWFDMKTKKINLLKEVEDKLSDDLNKKAAYLEAGGRAAMTWHSAITIAAILATIVFAYLVTREIVNPIGALRNSMEELANSDGDLSFRVEANGNDEIAYTARSFNKFMDGMQSIISKVKDSAIHVASASEELSASAVQIANGANEQSARTQQVATASQEMSATIVEVAKNSSGVSEAMRETSRIASKGGEVVEKNIKGINHIAVTTKEASAVIASLGSRSTEIGKIIKVIDGIADQTNLLALNAAIEAARAGEQGRGFAVVADEVRKLAERTTKATKEIGDMIKAIQDDTQKALTAMDGEVKAVEEGVSLTTEAGSTLKEIIAHVDKVSAMVQQIATATEEQSTAADQISGDIETVAGITKETATSGQQIAQSSQEIARLASSLQAVVGMFKIGGEEAKPEKERNLVLLERPMKELAVAN
ncbi:MAG: methyl-accepting chemotaxis protein, partial [Deltaproteobacteria bacterium]|nr:methyl-accepting chemotaxis protein [Deltaproteobacteria bacterium]